MTVQAVMEGDSFYNKNSAIQHVVDVQSIPFFSAAALAAALPPSGQPFVIADYGSSQGRNSMEPVAAAIDAVRTRAPLPVAVYHVDLPSNDFAALFGVLQDGAQTYLRGRPEVYPFAAGHSFFDEVLPPGTLSLGWSASAVHWLRACPAKIPDRLWAHGVGPTIPAAWQAQAEEDWRQFWRARARELRVGGQVVIATGLRNAETGFVGPDAALKLLDDGVREMVDEGRLHREEYENLVLPCVFRSLDEYAAPFRDAGFEHDGAVLRLVESCALDVPNVLLDRFERDHDAAAYGRAQSGFVRGFTAPIFRQQLASDRSPAERDAIIDDMFARLEKRCAASPAEAESRWRQVLLRVERSR